ncbi:MAG TPA: hypothetical protein PKN39_06840, partial [Oscillospiraceae bacterium]|nr:hypothetical protein [Oscillospiraceae bacterium]
SLKIIARKSSAVKGLREYYFSLENLRQGIPFGKSGQKSLKTDQTVLPTVLAEIGTGGPPH